MQLGEIFLLNMAHLANGIIPDCCSDYFLTGRAYDADRMIYLAKSTGLKIIIPPRREYDRHPQSILAGFNTFSYEELAKIYKVSVLVASCMVFCII